MESKAEKLGCEVLKGGIRVVAERGPDVLVTVNKVYFTVAAHLTNNADGSMQPKTDSSPAQPSTEESSSLGHVVVTTPSREPIPKGNVWTPSDDLGAAICPDSNAYADYDDAFIAWFLASGVQKEDAPSQRNSIIEKSKELVKPHGCNYVPPGTLLVSEGEDQIGAMAVVTAHMPDGTMIRGVTLPTMITQNQQQPTAAYQQVPTQDFNSPAAQPEVPQQSKPAPVEEAKPSAYQPEITQEPTTAQPPSNTPATVADVATSKELNAAGLRLLSATHPDFNEAKQAFEKAVQLDPANIEALNNLGYVYSRIGDYRSAEAVLLKVLAIAPTRRVANGNLGYAQAKLGKTQEAVNHYCQYVRQFDSLERGKSALVRANAADPDPNVQAAIKATVANCTR
jgi:tetratricopeptide (TPR) repeat protein